MKRIIFLILLIHLAVFVNAQSARIDSLERALHSGLAVDNKIVVLIKLSQIYAQQNTSQALKYGREAFSLAEFKGDKRRMADASYQIGDVFTYAGDYTQALIGLRQAMRWHDSVGLHVFAKIDSLRITDIYRFKSDHKQALVGYTYLQDYFSKNGDDGSIAKVYSGKAASYISKSEYQKAGELNDLSLAINKRKGDLSGMALNYANYARIHSGQANFIKALEQYQRALELNIKANARFGMSNNYRNIGILYNNLSTYIKAVDYYHRALKIDEELANQNGIASDLGNLGVVYGRLQDYPKAMEYFNRAYEKFSFMGDKYAMSYALTNIGNIQTLHFGDHEKALDSYRSALRINEELGDKRGMAGTYMSMGNVYITTKDYQQALFYFNQTLEIIGKMNDKSSLPTMYNNLTNAHIGLTNYRQAIEYASKAITVAQDIKSLESEKNARRNISEAYEKLGIWDSAYFYFKTYTVLKDTAGNDVMKSELSKKEMQYEFERKETELKYQQQLTEEKLIRSSQALSLKEQALLISTKEKDLQRLNFLKKQAELATEKAGRQQKEKEFLLSEEIRRRQIDNLQKENDIARLTESKRLGQIAGLGGILIGLFFVVIAFYYQNKKKQRLNTELTREKEKSDNLLLNILPAEIAEELKEKGKAEAKQYEEVTVMFTDFVNFTGISQHLGATQLVNEIDTCFSAFDAIVEKHGLEKIKTIGDAYMAVCGLPNAFEDHATRAVNAAIEMREFMAQQQAHGGLFEVRIGLHSGSVIAGIVGKKKFAYDIWGDTVNTAARMEQNSSAGAINISGSTYAKVSANIQCSYRGKIAAKNKGEIDMYFVG